MIFEEQQGVNMDETLSGRRIIEDDFRKVTVLNQ